MSDNCEVWMYQREESRRSISSQYGLWWSVILDGTRQAQMNHPLIRVKNPDGFFSHLHVHVLLMIVMGDQLSQDTLCCRRKANAGGAGRVHRSCMCSYLHSDDPLHKCTPVPKKLIDDILVVCSTTNHDVAEIIDKEDLIHKHRQDCRHLVNLTNHEVFLKTKEVVHNDPGKTPYNSSGCFGIS